MREPEGVASFAGGEVECSPGREGAGELGDQRIRLGGEDPLRLGVALVPALRVHDLLLPSRRFHEARPPAARGGLRPCTTRELYGARVPAPRDQTSTATVKPP